MRNLRESYSLLQTRGSFIYDLNTKCICQENKVVSELIESSFRKFAFTNEITFSANLKAYIFENSDTLTREGMALFASTKNETVYVSVCKYI